MLDVRRLEAELRRALGRFVAEVTSVVEQAIAESQTQARAEGRARGPKKRFRRRAASLERLAEAALAVLARRSHLAISEIAAEVGVTPREMLRPLTILIARRKVTKTGERRGTRYSLAPRLPVRPPTPASPSRKGSLKARAKKSGTRRK